MSPLRPAWSGVYPAVMTQLRDDLSVDPEATAAHLERLLAAGCHGLIMLGTLGENTSLSPDEKVLVLETAVATAAGRVPVLSGISEYTTAQAAGHAEAAAAAGCAGLMVLPAMVYKSDPRETLTHFRTVAAATDLPIMIYNNPPAYGVDVTPEMFVELAAEPTIAAIKESSEDPRRLVDIANLTGDRYLLFCGVDDVVLESVLLGAVGWVAGLVNAFPEEGVALFELAAAGTLGGGTRHRLLVHAPAAPRHQAQAGAVHQAHHAAHRPRQRARAPPAPAPDRRRARHGGAPGPGRHRHPPHPAGLPSGCRTVTVFTVDYAID